MNWDGNPKLQFDKRRLERCYQLDYKDIEYKEECLKKSKELKEKKPMGYKRRSNVMRQSPHSEPYWNFWRAVFAGWLIRYPRQIFKFIGISVLFLLFMIVSVTGGFDSVEPVEESGYNIEVIQ